jgi:adenylate cyclase class 2
VPPALNLELKVRDADPAATARACALLGAVEHGSMRQRDTYFDARTGRLKLREQLEGGGAELIYYERPAVEAVRASRYWRTPVPEPELLRELLARALGVLGVVEKTRRLFLFQHVRIHLDEVEGLGSFVELEAVQDGTAGADEPDAALARVLRALALGGREPIGGGYLELSTGRC